MKARLIRPVYETCEFPDEIIVNGETVAVDAGDEYITYDGSDWTIWFIREICDKGVFMRATAGDEKLWIADGYISPNDTCDEIKKAVEQMNAFYKKKEE